MLSSLQIENVAVIQKAEVHFNRCGQIHPDRFHQCDPGKPHFKGSCAHRGLQGGDPCSL